MNGRSEGGGLIKGIRLAFHGLAGLAAIALVIIGSIGFVLSPSTALNDVEPGERPILVFTVFTALAFLFGIWRPLQGGVAGFVCWCLIAIAISKHHGELLLGPGMFTLAGIAAMFVIAGVLKSRE